MKVSQSVSDLIRGPRTEGRRKELHIMVPAVSADIKRILGHDPRIQDMTKTDVEFLLSMGLLVNNPSDRVKLLVESYRFVCFFGGPSR